MILDIKISEKVIKYLEKKNSNVITVKLLESGIC